MDKHATLTVIISESCVGLKETWTNIETKTIFPARPGTKITLTCGEGYQLLGDDVITCQLEREFSFKNQPQCTISELDLKINTFFHFYLSLLYQAQ